MAFTFDPSTDRGAVRLYCWDNKDGTYLTDYNFTDADIDAFLVQNSDSIWLASADACRVLAVKAAAGAFSISIAGAIDLDKKKVSQMYLDLAKEYERRATSGPDMVTEYVDSFAILTDVLGRDKTEYISD